MKKLITMFLIIGILLCSMSNTVFAFSESAVSKTNGNFASSNETFTQADNKAIEAIDKYNVSIVQPKVEFTNIVESIRFETGDELKYELQLNVVDSFDYIVASFVSSQGVALNNYESITLDYSETVAPLSLVFNLNDYTSKCNIVLNYNDVEFEKIFIIVDVIEENTIVQTEKFTISAFFTNYGTFISNYGNLFAYDKYISYLYENNYITNDDVKKAHKRMTEIQVIDEKSKSEYSVLGDLEPNDMITYYNAKTESVSAIPADDYEVVTQGRLDMLNENQEVSLMATSTSGIVHSPSVRITRSITALSGGNQLKVYGYVYWTDIDGVSYPAREMEVQIMDEDVALDDARGTVYTNNNGYYTATIDNQNDIFENGCDIYVRINLSNSDFEIVSGVVSSIFSDGYYITTTVTENVTTSQSQVSYSGTGEEHYRCLSIHQAMVVGYYYYDAMNDGNTNTISIKYPHDDGSDSNSFTDYIRISYADYCDWDVIIHELGHQVATKINVDASFGEEHMGGENLMERYGKSKGIKGAWSEGWATYFSLAAQKYYNTHVVTISNITNVADTAYTSLSFDDSGDYYAGVHRDYSSYVGCGEGNEAAVTYVLFYLVYRAGLTHQELWDIAKESSCDRFSDFIKTLYDSVDESFYNEIGILLEEQNIADTPDVRTSIFSRSTPGTFYWDPVDTTDGASGNYQYYNDAVITFFDDNYNIVMESPIHASASGVYGVSINSALWRVLDLEITGDSFYWCIVTSQNDNPGTGPYYSTFHKAYFAEDITATATNAHMQYDGYLDVFDGAAYEFVVAIPKIYTFYSTGNIDVSETIY